MQSEVTYREMSSREPATRVAERSAEYLSQLEQRTEQYVAQIADFEARAGVPDKEQMVEEIKLLNDSVLQACADFEKACGQDAAAIAPARVRFRERTQAVLSGSNFINHARTWPRGHQGDYLILESAYRNMPASTGIGYYLDRYCLQTTLCVAVRERKNTLEDLLRAELAARSGARLLDVACGSCRDVFELAPEIDRTGAKVTCVDFDQEALEFGANRMTYAKIAPGRIAYRKYNAFKMINADRNLKEFGPQDVIYSVGFFDYVKDDVLARLLGALYQLLVPGGKLITSFKDCTRYAPQFYRWMVDWDGFFLRTEEDCRRILKDAGIPEDGLSFQREKTGVVMFLTATRK